MSEESKMPGLPEGGAEDPGGNGQGKRRLWRRLENVMFGVVVTLIILYFVLQSSAVQNWLISKITGYLSAELNTRVELKHVDFSFFDNLLLEGLYVEDLQGDTLLFAERFQAGLNSNIFTLLGNRLEFNEIGLTKARFNIRRLEGQSDNNLQFLIDYFAGEEPKPPKKPKPFRIRIQNLRLNDVQFLQDDKVSGKRLFVNVPLGVLRIKNLDLASNLIDVQSIFLEGFELAIAEYPPLKLDASQQSAAQKVAQQAPVEADTLKKKPTQLNVGRLILRNCQFSLDRFDSTPGKTTPDQVIDFQHLAVRNIAVEADSITANDELAFTGRLRHLAAEEQSGFVIKHLESRSVAVNDTLTALYGMRLETNGSVISDTLAMHYSTYRDFNRFTNRVVMEGRFSREAQVRLGDIMYFSPGIENNSFFIRNREELVSLSGLIEGKVNRLNGRNLDIRLGDNTVIKGNFDGDDMAEGSDRLRLLFDLEEAHTDMRTIRKVIPGFIAPAYFDRLGNVSFKGFYSIFFATNHILAGDIATNLGSGTIDMKLDLAGGREKATYSGFLNMNNFDLATWTGRSDFGNATFRVNIEKGAGLTLSTIETNLTGTVDSFYYRGYNYQNIALNGLFNKSLFTGRLNIEDPNIDFAFNGTINFKDSIPQYDFNADLHRLDLGALNLVQQDWVLSGNIQINDLFFRNLNDLRGNVVLRGIRLIEDKQYVHRIDSLRFSAFNQPNGERNFVVLSDMVDGSLTGKFEIDRMGENALRILQTYYPALVRQALGYTLVDTLPLTDQYKINLRIKDTRSWTRLFDPNLDTIRDLRVVATIDVNEGQTGLQVQMPMLRYNGLTIQNASFNWNSLQTNGSFWVDVPEVLLANGQRLARLNLSGNANLDTLKFLLVTDDSTSIVQRINLSGALATVDSLWQVQFNTSAITLFDEQWFMDDDNYLRFSSDYFEARNFDLMNGLQRIIVESYNDGKGARFSLANFDLNFIERFFKVNNVSYRGKIYNLDCEISNVFAFEGIQAFVSTDTVFLNDKSYGRLFGNLEMKDLNSPVWWKMFLIDKDIVSDSVKHQLRILGTLVPEGQPKVEIDELGTVRPGEFQAMVSADGFPLEVLEFFIPEISRTSGTINTEVRMGGPLNRVSMRGKAIVDGSFQFDYFKSIFYLPKQTVTLTEYQIWADGDTILDASRKNMAFIKGGLRHDHFKDWRLDCEIKSAGSNFLVMNTLRDDNPLYYGQGIGSFLARFSGSFSKTNIYVEATTGKETRLYIPLSSATSDVLDANFITFRNKNEEAGTSGNDSKRFVLSELKGLNFEMNLSITDDADIELIFDEQAGDLVKGRGEGNIRLVINREGEFLMYGTYYIRRGEYLFTLLNWVNKPFTVAEGGFINWYGDPYKAQISLDATYVESTSPYNLLREELVVTNNDLNNEARKSTRVVVTMHLKGDLFKPSISFDIACPDIAGQLKSLVDSKMSLLRQDQNELTRQVFGLVVVGSFLPPASGSATLQSSDYIASAFNTLTQVLSNQFSNYLTALFSEWFGGKVSSIDFDIAYNEYRNQTDPSQGNLTQIGRDLQLRLTSGFADDRITVQFGGQFGLGRPGTSANENFWGEDIAVEIQLTENRQWRLKVYQRTEPDVAGGSRRSRYGFGISFRKEYDSFSDLLSGLTGWMRKGS